MPAPRAQAVHHSAGTEAVLALAQQTADRLLAHETRCNAREDESRKSRAAFRAEVKEQHHELGERIGMLAVRIDGKIDALSSELQTTAATLHGRITDNRVKALIWVIAALLGLVGLIGGGFLYLLTKQLGL